MNSKHSRFVVVGWVAVFCVVPAGEGVYAEKRATQATMIPNPHDMPPVQVSGVGSWINYSDQENALGCVFEYPENWAVGTERGQKQAYSQAVILGPRNASNTFSAGLTVRRMMTKASGGLYADLESLKVARQKQYGANAHYKKLDSGEQVLGGQKAAWMVIEYNTPLLPANDLHAFSVTVRMKLVQFAIGNTLYEISYAADVGQYARYEAVFEHLLQTLTIAAVPPASETA